MYNAEIKDKFIRESNLTESRRKFCCSLFEAISKYEEQWGADICTQSVEFVQPVVDAVSGFQHRSSLTAISNLRKYAKWCLDNNIPNATDTLLRIKNVGDSKLKNQMLSNPLHLQRYLDCICAPENAKRIDNTYRCYYWLAYSGMSEDDIFLVKSSDVDFLRRIIRYNGYEYPIYEPAIPALMNCVNMTSFISTSAAASIDKPFITRGEGEILIRGTKPYVTSSTFRPMLSRLSTKAVEQGSTSLKISYNRVWLSGLFFRMHERELAGYDVSFKGVVLEQLMKKYPDKPLGDHNITYIRQKSSKYLLDYKRWKKVFNI